MVNEVLCKIVCHNISVLIQETHELGINVEFSWGPSCGAYLTLNGLSRASIQMPPPQVVIH
jgi:hypothetical protein